MAIQEKFVQAGEYRTHYWEVGAGENVLMLHSADPGSGGWLEFRENMEALGKQFRVLAPDIIGFGKTDVADARTETSRLCRTYGAISRCAGSEKDPLGRQLPRRIDQHFNRGRAPGQSRAIDFDRQRRRRHTSRAGAESAGTLRQLHGDPGKSQGPSRQGILQRGSMGAAGRSSINIWKRARVNTAPMPSWAATRWMCQT